MSVIRTFSGINVDLLRPDPSVVKLEDIAHSLAAVNRFNGHTQLPYSVGQHSVYVSQLVADMEGDRREQLRGLLHDATEAYLGDIVSPLKYLPQNAWIVELEADWEMAIAAAFGLDELVTPLVKAADKIALAMEARDQMGNPHDWKFLQKITAPPWRIIPIAPMQTKRLFMERYDELVHHPILVEA